MSREKQTYNPCDDCPHSYSKNAQESGMCKICEFIYFRDRKQSEGVKEVLEKAASKFAGYSDYHGDTILQVLYCMAEGKEVDNAKPLDAKQGENVIELPCKVGTTLYFLYNNPYADKPDLKPRIYKTTDWYFEVDKTGIAINTSYIHSFNKKYDYYLGKTVFHTKQEAEQAIAKMKGE